MDYVWILWSYIMASNSKDPSEVVTIQDEEEGKEQDWPETSTLQRQNDMLTGSLKFLIAFQSFYMMNNSLLKMIRNFWKLVVR